MVSRILLIIAHGSRSSAWNHAIETFCSNLQQAQQAQQRDMGIDQVRWCYLEHAQPSIQAALEHHCKETAQEIIALPLFLSVGQHVSNDIPSEVASVATLLQHREGKILYECHGSSIQLLDPPPTLDLISDNIERRIKRLDVSMSEKGIVVVYYGAKKFLRQWNHLAFNIQSQLLERFPHSQVNWGYGGDAVDFAPESLAEVLTQMAANVEKIVIVPALVAVGVVQNEVIPAAIDLAQLGDRIIYSGDALLPDTEMEKSVLDYVHKLIHS